MERPNTDDEGNVIIDDNVCGGVVVESDTTDEADDTMNEAEVIIEGNEVPPRLIVESTIVVTPPR